MAVNIFGEKSFTYDEVSNQAYITKNGVLLAIFRNDGMLRIHIRAGLTPNMAGFIVGMFFSVVDFSISENFEVDFEGNMIFGNEALRFVAKNAEKLWFGDINKEVDKASKELVEKSKFDRRTNTLLN